ncbi:hypothetical protein [Luteolibacter sp. LG18]|uniref:hypothetical protein n=1 Tax=Luteolibacter sp. LG18 TaxID=2819286 RepID=UPI002B2E33E6|nr:hypothetical protein llg_42810 [Luteolibacter sp. LG18]
MKDSPITSTGSGFLPLAVLALVAWRAVPGLVEAWRTDVYSRGGLVAAVIWMIPALYRIRGDQGRGTGFQWMLLALAFGVAGAVSSLWVFDHLSLAAAIGAIARPRRWQLAWAPAALSWLPAAGWFVSRVLKGGVAGWERPLVAAAGVCVFFLAGHRKPLMP